MNWDAIGAIGEILGATAVLITLIYLATQVRRSNELSRFNATKEIANQYNDLNKLLTTESELRQLLMKTEKLSEDENEQIYNFAVMFCNIWVSAQIAYDNDQIEKNVYKACARDVSIELERWRNFRPAVERWLNLYSEYENVEIMQPIVSGRNPNTEFLNIRANDT